MTIRLPVTVFWITLTAICTKENGKMIREMVLSWWNIVHMCPCHKLIFFYMFLCVQLYSLCYNKIFFFSLLLTHLTISLFVPYISLVFAGHGKFISSVTNMRYTGSWRDGLKDGMGSLHFPSGDLLEGRWSDVRLKSNWHLIWSKII